MKIEGVYFAQADALHLPLADKSVDLVFCSPPYTDARTYGIGAERKCAEWVEWMLSVVSEMTRVSRGLVLVNCAGVTRQRVYQPGPEGLMWEWWKRGGNLWRPAFWHRVGIPGSGGAQWLRADIEYVLCFKRDREWLPWADNTANGHPPKWAPGGEMSHRLSSGARVNQWGHPIDSGGTGGPVDDVTCGSARPSHMTVWGNRPSRAGKRPNGSPNGNYFNGNGFRVNERRRDGTRGKLHTKSLADGSDEVQCYVPPVLANPGNLVKVKVGGGVMGHPLAHENEAPFPTDLAAWFIRSWCPPGGIVLDCFSGSGTTVDAAWREGRKGIGLDLRMSQCALGRRRMREPYAKKSKPKNRGKETSLFPEVA